LTTLIKIVRDKM